MSYGLVVCSACHREVHQQDRAWHHCEDKSPRCEGATIVYPERAEQIVGRWCGRDDLDGIFPNYEKLAALRRGQQCSCGCSHVIGYNDNGSCPTYLRGANGRCVYCDHAIGCHAGAVERAERKKRRRKLYSNRSPW